MSARYTKPGPPTMADHDPRIEPYGPPRIAPYGQAGYDAGRADHIAEVGQMAPLTHEQTREIARRFGHLLGNDLVRAVVRATENAHGIATPKDAL